VERRVKDASCVVFAYHEMGYACLKVLFDLGASVKALFTHPDDPQEVIWWRSCAELAAENGVPVYRSDEFDPAWVELVEKLRPDIIYSFYYRRLLPESVLKLARIGAFNVHGSLLPAYRGRAPVNWVLVNGEKRTGVTLHHMVAKADAGDIVAQEAVDIADDDTAFTLYQKLVAKGADLLRYWHPRIVDGTAPRYPQDPRRASYFGRRTPEDGRIDWSWPARRIFNLVRAVTHPYPGAFCFLDERKIFVWAARVADETNRLGEPGEIIEHCSDGTVEVAAGQGSVRLLSIQPEGGEEGCPQTVLGQDLLNARLK